MGEAIPSETDRPRQARTGLVRKALDTLGTEIVGGTYGVGDLLPTEPDLAVMLDVSRLTVREVVRTLVALGMLEVRTRVGTRVRARRHWNVLNRDVLTWMMSLDAPNGELVAAIDEAREIFEPQAAALAASRATAVEIAAIRAAYEAMVDAAEQRDAPAAIRADRAFHRAILAATGNPILAAFDSAIDAVLGLLFEVATADHKESFRENLANHRRIFEAIRDGRPEDARGAMIDTIRYTRGNLTKHGLRAAAPTKTRPA